MGLQPLSLQSQHREGRAQVSPSQIPESIPAPLLFFLLFSGLYLCSYSRAAGTKDVAADKCACRHVYLCRDAGVVCFLLVLLYQSSLAFPGCFTRTAKC